MLMMMMTMMMMEGDIETVTESTDTTNTAAAMDDSLVFSPEELEGMTLGGPSSLPYGGATLKEEDEEDEERPGSSLSSTSRSSRIPVLARSLSLRVKPSSAFSLSQDQGHEAGATTKGASKASGKGRSDAPRSPCSKPGAGKGLVRSASFVSSRGMKGFSSSSSSSSPPSSRRHPAHPVTPETNRRAHPKHHTLPHAKRTSPPHSNSTTTAITPDRKSHSYAGMVGNPLNNHHNYNHNHHHHHQYHSLTNTSTTNSYHNHHGRRPNFLPVSTSSTTPMSSQFSSLPTTPASHPDTPSRSPDSNDAEDADSIKSFGSVSSAVSCDAALALHNNSSSSSSNASSRHHHNHNHHHLHHYQHQHQHQDQSQGASGGSKGVRSLKYVLHCRHNHEHDPEQYLTPTQRAARRIRELKAQLSEARREVFLRDNEIVHLTRELVELRLLKARGPQWDDEEEEEAEGERRGTGGGADGGIGGKVARKVELVGAHVSIPPVRTTTTTTIHIHTSSAATAESTTSTTNAIANNNATTAASAGTPSEGSEPELRRLMEVTNECGGAPDPAPSHLPRTSVSPAGRSLAETTTDSVDFTRSSLADSGHFDDLSSRDTLDANRGSSARGIHTRERSSESTEADANENEHGDEAAAVAVGGGMPETSTTTAINGGGGVSEGGDTVDSWVAVEVAEEKLREEYHRREEALKRNHLEEYNELKEKHNDRVETLLSKLSDANLKYFELRPLYDQSLERGRDLAHEVMRLKEELTEADLRHQKMYLQMFLKGQQAARIQAEDDLVGGEEGLPSSSGPMMELMRQLTRTEEELEKVKALYHREVTCRNNNNNGSGSRRNGELDPEVTLQFLKSAIYYFFTDRDNAKGHLHAIESILGYSDSERYNIGKVIK